MRKARKLMVAMMRTGTRVLMIAEADVFALSLGSSLQAAVPLLLLLQEVVVDIFAELIYQK